MWGNSSNFAPENENAIFRYKIRNKVMKNLNMSTFKKVVASCQWLVVSGLLLLMADTIHAQQLPNASFEDWSGAQFDGNIQPASWNVSNVTQFGFKFNVAYREAGHTGS